MRIRLENLNAGWVDLIFEVGDLTYSMLGVSYVRNALPDLLSSGFGALRGQPQIIVRFLWEPGMWRLAVSHDGAESKRVKIQIHEFSDWPNSDPTPMPKPVFEAECEVAAYARAVRNAFAVWKNQAADFEARWCGPFPRGEFDTLDAALK